MGFVCEPCFENRKIRCPSPFVVHFQSHGACEYCRKTGTCADCPTSHVASQLRAAHPELVKLEAEVQAAEKKVVRQRGEVGGEAEAEAYEWVDHDDGHAGGFPHPHLWPSGYEFIGDLRRALGLFDGAMPISPKQAWTEAIEEVRRLSGLWKSSTEEERVTERQELSFQAHVLRILGEAIDAMVHAQRALRHAEEFHQHLDEMNARTHLARVRYSPLTMELTEVRQEVTTVLTLARRAANGEFELPLEFADGE